jgi:hypothetical protein
MEICELVHKYVDVAIHQVFNVRAKYPFPRLCGVGAGKISVVFFRHVNELVTIPL